MQGLAMRKPSAGLAQAFSNIGHTLDHALTTLFPTVVLVLEVQWGLSYDELIALFIAANILFGLGALPAGWLGDRWSTMGMMVIYFIGLGAATIATGFASNPLEIAFGLAATGIFASIYHPVGMSWLVRTASNRGRALGFNGMFGAIGVATGPLIAGALIAASGWRAAFFVPGAVAIAVGLALWAAWRLGYVEDRKVDLKPQPEPDRGHVVRAFWILSVTMTAGGLIGSSFMFVLPKFFETRLGHEYGLSVFQISLMVSAVFLVASTAQYVGGRLADRLGMRRMYFTSFLALTPILFLAAVLDGWPLLFVAIAMVFVNITGLPAENAMVAHYTPSKWRGTAYGAKFVLALGVSAAAIPVVGMIYRTTGDFLWLFVILGACAAIVTIGATLLPDDRAPMPRATPRAAPAAAE
jgi:MFS family permease